jgi:hypothetical protein
MANAAELAASVKAQGERVKALKAEKKVIVHFGFLRLVCSSFVCFSRCGTVPDLGCAGRTRRVGQAETGCSEKMRIPGIPEHFFVYGWLVKRAAPLGFSVFDFAFCIPPVRKALAVLANSRLV